MLVSELIEELELYKKHDNEAIAELSLPQKIVDDAIAKLGAAEGLAKILEFYDVNDCHISEHPHKIIDCRVCEFDTKAQAALKEWRT